MNPEICDQCGEKAAAACEREDGSGWALCDPCLTLTAGGKLAEELRKVVEAKRALELMKS